MWFLVVLSGFLWFFDVLMVHGGSSWFFLVLDGSWRFSVVLDCPW